MPDFPRWFGEIKIADQCLAGLCSGPPPNPLTFEEILCAIEYLHIECGLLRPYTSDYPLVEPRELIPAFDAPLIEYKQLPAFSMLVLDRPLNLPEEGFQLDVLWPEGQPPDVSQVTQNRLTLRERLPRNQHKELEQILGRRAVTPFSRYGHLMPLLGIMDRGHVITKEPEHGFSLTGIFASFPSELDREIKRLGKHIGKFTSSDNRTYAADRKFVYNFLMERMGFPICGERHTSAALFALRLQRRKERFAMKVLGSSDRTITSFSSQASRNSLPSVEKVALVTAQNRKDLDSRLNDAGFYMDPERKVVILKVYYAQHSYHADNVLQDRALSVYRQEVIHPHSGQILEMDILGMSQDRMLLLNDIVQGEHRGSIVYRGRERLEGTDDFKKRLMFLEAWLHKHHSILAEYSAENFDRLLRILHNFLERREFQEELALYAEFKEDIDRAVEDLRLTHGLRALEKSLNQRRKEAGNKRMKPAQALTSLSYVLENYGEQLRSRQPRVLQQLLSMSRKQLKSLSLRRIMEIKRDASGSLCEEVSHLEQLIRHFESACGLPAETPVQREEESFV